MPWIKDCNGNDKYIVSTYAKEELPTWQEMYNWLQKKEYIHDPSVDDYIEPYWNIPHRLYTIAIVCNELNKMIFEDGKQNSFLELLNNKQEEIDYTIIDARWIITNELYDDIIKLVKMINNNNSTIYADHEFITKNKLFMQMIGFNDMSTPPPIYTISLPSRKENPFIINNHKRINVTSLIDKRCGLSLAICTNVNKKFQNYDFFNYEIIDPSKIHDDEKADKLIRIYSDAIAILTYDIYEYFGGKIGWKDIETELVKQTNCDIPR